jgi:hypothetical protein
MSASNMVPLLFYNYNGDPPECSKVLTLLYSLLLYYALSPHAYWNLLNKFTVVNPPVQPYQGVLSKHLRTLFDGMLKNNCGKINKKQINLDG